MATQVVDKNNYTLVDCDVTISTANETALEKRIRRLNVKRWLIVLVCFLGAGATTGCLNYSFGVFIPFLEADFGWSRYQTNVAFTVGITTAAISAPITGRILDRYGVKVYSTITYICLSAGFIVRGVTSNLWIFYVSNFISFIGYQGPVRVLAGRLIPHYFPKRKGLLMAVTMSGTNLGGVYWPPLSTYLMRTLGWAMTSFIMGVFLGIIGILHFLVIDDPPEGYGISDDGSIIIEEQVEVVSTETNGNETSTDDGKTELDMPAQAGMSVSQAFRAPAYYVAGVAIIFCGLHLMVVNPQFVPHLIQHGMETEKAALFLSIAAGSSVLCKFFFGYIAERYSARTAMFLLGLTASSGVAALTYSRDNIWTYFIVTLYGFSFGLGVLRPLLLTDTVGYLNYGVLFGYILLLDVVMVAAAPVFAGIVFDMFGNYNLIFMACAGLSLTGGILALTLGTVFKQKYIKHRI